MDASEEAYPLGNRLREYDILETINIGQYAVLHRGRDRQTGLLVDIKIISKTFATKYKKRIILQNLSIHLKLRHPNVLKLHKFFQDGNNIVGIYEPTQKGLFARILSEVNIPERIAIYVFLQVFRGVLYLRSRSIVIRDLTLYNVSLGNDCNIKIGEFHSTNFYNEPIPPMDGTSDLLLPRGVPNNRRDIRLVWNLGYLLYSFLVGFPPFPNQMPFQNTIGANYQIPEGLSNEANDLINMLLQKNQAERMPISEIIYHPLFLRLNENPNVEFDPCFLLTNPVPLPSSFQERLSLVSFGHASGVGNQQNNQHLEPQYQNLCDLTSQEDRMTKFVEYLKQPICTDRLQRQTQVQFEFKNYIILDDGSVKITTYEQLTDIIKVFVVSKDGEQITLQYSYGGELENFCPPDPYSWEILEMKCNRRNLPDDLLSDYAAASYFVYFVKSKTVKIIYNSNWAKFSLMENAIDMKAEFNDGLQIETSIREGLKITEPNGRIYTDVENCRWDIKQAFLHYKFGAQKCLIAELSTKGMPDENFPYTLNE